MPSKKGRENGASRERDPEAKEKLYSTLIQTLVPIEVGRRIKELAREEGMSLAAYVRRLILIDWRKKSKHPSAQMPVSPVRPKQKHRSNGDTLVKQE
ncbi:MAG: hypothetical protein ACYDH4_09980 [Candidatus Cryosericum sp.]